MTRLFGDLIPDEVPLVRLGDIATLVRGNGLQRKDLTSEGVGAIHYGQIYTHYGPWSACTKSFVSPELAKQLKIVEPGDVVITNTSENVEDVCKAVAWVGKDTIVTGGHATIIKHSQDPKYLAYWFQTEDFARQKRRFAMGTKVIEVSIQKLATAVLPLPSLDVQREIVGVLDTFTQLEAELEARRKQYAHYRESMFRRARNFDPDSHVLSDAVTLNFGQRITKSKNLGTKFPVYGGGGVSFWTDHSNAKDSWVVSRFAMSEKCVRWVSGDFWLLDSGFTFTPKNDICRDYIGEYLSHIQPIIYETSTQSAQRNIDVDGFKRIRIPLPPLPIQVEIASELGKFAKLVTSLSSGLPAEIAARRRQYEFYRDQLLSFGRAA